MYPDLCCKVFDFGAGQTFCRKPKGHHGECGWDRAIQLNDADAPSTAKSYTLTYEAGKTYSVAELERGTSLDGKADKDG